MFSTKTKCEVECSGTILYMKQHQQQKNPTDYFERYYDMQCDSQLLEIINLASQNRKVLYYEVCISSNYRCMLDITSSQRSSDTCVT